MMPSLTAAGVAFLLMLGTDLALGYCERIHPRDVVAEGEWYLILRRDPARSPWESETLDIEESVPVLEAEPSPDRFYWRCANEDGSRKSFLVPWPAGLPRF
jgi:hypothetical protein